MMFWDDTHSCPPAAAQTKAGRRQPFTKSLGRLITVPLVAVLLTLTAGSAAAHDLSLHTFRANGVDLTRLTLGDGKYSTTAAAVGSIYLFAAAPSTTQDTIDAPWINGDGTFNASIRPVVDGSVSWTSVFSALVQGVSRIISVMGCRPHTTGVYPIASNDDAYAYDRNPNSIAEGSISGTLTASPTLLSAPSCMGGEVGVALNGVTILNGLNSRAGMRWRTSFKMRPVAIRTRAACTTTTT